MQVPADALFCPQCGEDVGESAVSDPNERLRKRLSRVLADRYRVGAVLGAGGMGVVFLAEDLKHERNVAIKVLAPELTADAKIVERFDREARTAAALQHPGIVAIHEAGSEQGLHYFVMQYVDGQTLDDLLASRSPLPIDVVTRVLREAAAALGYAHRQGVVHRDVKPANIIIDSTGRTLLADFGISKVVNAKGDATTVRKLTQTGGIVGTPHYMAPEHALGQDVDGRTDQYALAVVGFHMLAGRVPFDDETLPGIIHLHINEAAPRLSSLRPDIPAQLPAAIARAMSKARNNRFDTIEEFAAAALGTPASRGGTRRRAWVAAIVLMAALGGAALWARHRGWELPSGWQRTGAAVTAPAPTQRMQVRFDVTSTPAAVLYVDGRRVGQTPIVNGRLSVGVHELRLERTGYRPMLDTIRVTAQPDLGVRRSYVLRRVPR